MALKIERAGWEPIRLESSFPMRNLLGIRSSSIRKTSKIPDFCDVLIYGFLWKCRKPSKSHGPMTLLSSSLRWPFLVRLVRWSPIFLRGWKLITTNRPYVFSVYPIEQWPKYGLVKIMTMKRAGSMFESYWPWTYAPSKIFSKVAPISTWTKGTWQALEVWASVRTPNALHLGCRIL